jgi:hypothetical protein
MRRQLAPFGCLEVAPDLSAAERQTIREILLQFNELSDYQTLGVCAEDLMAGRAALEAYVAALGLTARFDLPDLAGPVYIKFNTLKGNWYLDAYPGPSRGVLVSYHASEPEVEEVNGTYGPFPLDLFTDAPEPA